MTSEFFRQAHERWGVKLDFRQGLSRIEGSGGRVERVETTDGRTLPADLVVFGIGVLPNVHLAAEAGLDIENGIKVDPYLSTSDPAISAIGDCAAFPSAHTTERVRLESVQNATDQGRTVAARLVGKASPYTAVPWFWTEQGDLKLQMVGLIDGYDTAVVVGDRRANSFSVLCFRRGHLVGVESVNRPVDHVGARRLLAGSPTLSAREAAAPGFDLRAWERGSQ